MIIIVMIYIYIVHINRFIFIQVMDVTNSASYIVRAILQLRSAAFACPQPRACAIGIMLPGAEQNPWIPLDFLWTSVDFSISYSFFWDVLTSFFDDFLWFSVMFHDFRWFSTQENMDNLWEFGGFHCLKCGYPP